MLQTIHNEKLSRLDFQNIVSLGNNCYELVLSNKSILIEVLKVDIDEKKITIRHSHTTHDIVFKEEIDLVLDKMGIKRSAEKISRDVKAPMPGKVIDLIAKEGDQLEKGDGILILEAMKMENVIKAEASCKVKKILVANLDNVEKNQILIELEPIG